jgi:hypothetical protein
MELEYLKFKIFAKRININPKKDIEINKIEGENLMSEADFIVKKINLMIEKAESMDIEIKNNK